MYLVLSGQEAQLVDVTISQPVSHLARLLLTQLCELPFVTPTGKFDVSLQQTQQGKSDP